MTSGIYKITDTDTGEIYIGGSVNIEHRMSTHKSLIKHKKHYNLRLSKIKNYTHCVILMCDKSMVKFYEQLCINALKPELNVSTSATGTSPEHWSDDRKRKYSEQNPMKKADAVYKNSSSRKGTRRPDLAERNRLGAGKKPWNYGKTSLSTSYANAMRHVVYWGA